MWDTEMSAKGKPFLTTCLGEGTTCLSMVKGKSKKEEKGKLQSSAIAESPHNGLINGCINFMALKGLRAHCYILELNS